MLPFIQYIIIHMANSMVTNDGLLTHIVTGDHQAVANVSALVQYLIALQKKLHEAHSQ